MTVVDVHEAEAHLSRLLEQASAGEEIVIARGGTPVARLVPLETKPRRPGRLRNRITIGPDFDEPLPEEILAAFRGGEE